MGSAHILLIDDDSALRGAIQRSLPTHGFEVSSVPSARAAVSELSQRAFDLILIDMQMPEITGDVLVRELAKRGSKLPVIVVSGTQRVSDVIKMMRLGVQDFVHKPFGMGELVDAIRRTLGLDSDGAAGVLPDARRPGSASSNVFETLLPESEKSVRRPVTSALPDLLTKLKRGRLRLPVLDPRVADIQNFISSPDAGIDEVLGVIGRDPILTASVLQVANSGYYSSGARAFQNLRDASVRIGNRQVLTVAMQVLIRNAFTCRLEPFRTLMSHAWENAHVTARIAARLAARCGQACPEDLYVAGLLHNAGELVMLQLFSEVYDSSGGMSVSETMLSEALNLQHERFGEVLARAWSQPPLVRRLTGIHHSCPSGEGPDERQQRLIVLTAWSMACAYTPKYIGAEHAPDVDLLVGDLPLTAEEFSRFREDVSEWSTGG